jgi:hypothetical protein
MYTFWSGSLELSFSLCLKVAGTSFEKEKRLFFEELAVMLSGRKARQSNHTVQLHASS